MKKYDAIVIGGGINSLTISTLLTHEKKTVLLLESQPKLGGMAITEEFSPGFNCNLVYDYSRWISPVLIEKIKLNNYALNIHSPDPLRISLDENKQHILFYQNPRNTAESIANHSKVDAEKWIRFTKHIDKLTHFLESIYQTTPPNISDPSISDALSLSKKLPLLWKYGTRGIVDTLRTIPMMMPELLDEWFESKLLRGSLATGGIVNISQGPYSAATGLNFLHQHIYSKGKIHNAYFFKGGTEKFAKSLFQISKGRYFDMQTNTHVSKINCINGSCTGITTLDGKTYYSDIVVSGLDPNQTYCKLIKPSELSPTFRTQLSNIKYRGSSARIHFAIDKYPEIIGIDKHNMDSVFAINPSIEYLERAYDDAKYGNISDNPYIEFTIPSILNPHFAPSGKHVISATLQYIPYIQNDDKQNTISKKHLINKVIKSLEKFIPDFSKMIEHTLLITPLDLENKFALTQGNLNHGEMTLDQFFFMRPTISSSQYGYSIKNLFLCGPGTHPGGGLHGLNAVNAAHEILKY